MHDICYRLVFPTNNSQNYNNETSLRATSKKYIYFYVKSSEKNDLINHNLLLPLALRHILFSGKLVLAQKIF